MNESEFLELLNLYLDHEITPVDAARLEAEIRTNPKRREIYREYCRLQNACKMLAADFGTEEATRAPKSIGNEMQFGVHVPSQTKRARLLLAGTGLAAVACVAFVLLAPQRSAKQVDSAVESTAASALVLQGSGPNPLGNGAQVTVGGIPTEVSSDRVLVGMGAGNSLVGIPLVLSGRPSGEPLGRLISSSTVEVDQLTWVRNFQVGVPQQRNLIDQLRFEPAPASLRPQGRPLGGRSSDETAVEMSAFRFGK